MFQHSLHIAKATLPCLIILSSLQGAASSETPSLLELCAKKIAQHNIPYKHTPARFIIYPEIQKFEHERIQRLNSIKLSLYTQSKDLGLIENLLAPTEPWNNPHEIALCRHLKKLIMGLRTTAGFCSWPFAAISLTGTLCAIEKTQTEPDATFGVWCSMCPMLTFTAVGCCLPLVIKKLKLTVDPVFDALSCSSQWRSHLEPPRPMVMRDFDANSPENHEKRD